ncbi:MAG: glycosyltransferase family 39 protein [Acidobacteriota bacterium]|nr:glycosyltransferase family 39 protein [Acidobacteriota bacterium]
MPAAARFGLGAAIESCMVFLLLLAGWANWMVFLAGGLLLLGAVIWLRPPALNMRRASIPWPLCIVFAAYGALYLVNALAPEIQSDAAGYHLGLVSEYVRLGRFPGRVGFFEMAPQGLDMLFTVAFAFGRHSAAKLVHFAFLIAAVPLLRAIGRELKLSDRVALVAAALYFCAPVVGVSGTSAYTDAGLVFFVLLILYFVLAKQWAAAGIASGFCFAIKFTGLFAVPVAALATRRFRPALIVSATAALLIAPWMIRATVMTGNPVAPLFNRVFPNPYFRASTDQRLGESMRHYAGFRWQSAAIDYTVKGNLQGAAGPAFLLLPFGLLALRSRAGRIVWLAALVSLIPWFWNKGARFLMPALPFFALALAIALPKPLAWACVALQAIACWPAVMPRYQAPFAWRLEGFPWKAALRIDPEADYLARNSGDYQVARMVEANTKSSDRIFCLDSLAMAYSTRDVTMHWHTARADALTDALTEAAEKRPMVRLRFDWAKTSLRGIRFLGKNEWMLFETSLYSDGDRVFNSPMWLLSAKPDLWEAPLAVDDNRATSWRGNFLQIEFDHPQMLTRADLLCDRSVPMVAEGMGTDGQWRLLLNAPDVSMADPIDLRRDAVRALKSAGFTFVVAGTGAKIGKDMVENGADWGVMNAGAAGQVRLFQIM